VPTDDTGLQRLLRDLDDPEHLEWPAGYDDRATRARFERLAQRLDTDFGTRCDVDRHVQDASHHGRIEVPAAATASGRRLVLVVSNFGDLAVVTVDNPGCWTDAEAAALLHPDDDRRARAALADLGWVLVPEEPLWRPYDGAVRPPHRPRNWWTRFFDHL
jgi:hypothetical protein